MNWKNDSTNELNRLQSFAKDVSALQVATITWELEECNIFVRDSIIPTVLILSILVRYQLVNLLQGIFPILWTIEIETNCKLISNEFKFSIIEFIDDLECITSIVSSNKN